MNPIKPAVKRLIGVFASLAFFIGSISVFSTLIVPESNRIQQLRGERAALNELYEKELATVKAVKSVFEQFGSVSSLQDTLSLALPTEEDVPGIVNQINGIAKASGIVIDAIDMQLLSITPVEQNDAVRPVGTVRISLDVQGSYESIKLYLQALETNVRIMDVQTLGVQGGIEGEVLSYSVVILAYYQV